MKRLLNDMTPLITEKEIDQLVIELAATLNLEYAGKEVIIICPLKGSVLFVADLMRKLTFDQKLDFVHLTSPKNENVRILKDVNLNIKEKHLLIVEEIIDAGRTLSFLKTRLLASNPASLKVVTLFDKPARRELPIKADYIGQIIDDRYVVGYGMDSEEVGRNYKNLYAYSN
jgi:hypoxanthine phosphoribosyltransferase